MEAVRGDWSHNYRRAYRPCLEDLVLDAGPGSHWRDCQPRLSETSLYALNVRDNFDTCARGQCNNFRCWTTADDLEDGIGDALVNSGPDLVCEVKNSIDVRLITHDAGEHHG